MRETQADIQFIDEVITTNHVRSYIFRIAGLYDLSWAYFSPAFNGSWVLRIAIASASDDGNDPPRIRHTIFAKEIGGTSENRIYLPAILANRRFYLYLPIYAASGTLLCNLEAGLDVRSARRTIEEGGPTGVFVPRLLIGVLHL
jgi:hypothetical protein